MNPFLPRYQKYPGNTEKVFNAICSALSERIEQVDWTCFEAADWDLLLHIAQAEGVAPLLYKTVERWNMEGLTFHDATFQRLRDGYYANLRRNILLFHELERVLEALGAAEIPVVLLKGAAYAESLYGDIGLRPMNDLDLLVPVARLDQAVQAVTSLGYAETIPEIVPGLNRQLSHHIALQKTTRQPVSLELHWTLAHTPAYKYTVPVDWFWTQTENVSHKCFNVQRLNATASLLYSAAHLAFQHGLGQTSLTWLLDLDRLVRSEQVDWEGLSSQAGVLGWRVVLYSVLSIAQSCFGTQLPEYIPDLLDNRQETGMAELINLKQQRDDTNIFYHVFASLKGLARIHLFIALIFPSPAYLIWRYHPKPAWIWPIYYPYRWIISMFHLFKNVFQARQLASH